MATVYPPVSEDRILGLQTQDELVWVGDDVVTISWAVRHVPIDEHGSTAVVHGYAIQMADTTVRFVPDYKVRRIFRADGAEQ